MKGCRGQTSRRATAADVGQNSRLPSGRRECQANDSNNAEDEGQESGGAWVCAEIQPTAFSTGQRSGRAAGREERQVESRGEWAGVPGEVYQAINIEHLLCAML